MPSRVSTLPLALVAPAVSPVCIERPRKRRVPGRIAVSVAPPESEQ